MKSPGLPAALLIAGPTASGKSALALEIAERVDGTIINTDSMQVYRELHVLTARPSAEDERRAPHRLYGVRPAAQPGSVAWWRQAALAAMEPVPCRRPPAHPDRRQRPLLRGPHRWVGRDPRPRLGRPRGGTSPFGRAGVRSPARQLAGG